MAAFPTMSEAMRLASLAKQMLQSCRTVSALEEGDAPTLAAVIESGSDYCAQILKGRSGSAGWRAFRRITKAWIKTVQALAELEAAIRAAPGSDVSDISRVTATLVPGETAVALAKPQQLPLALQRPLVPRAQPVASRQAQQSQQLQIPFRYLGSNLAVVVWESAFKDAWESAWLLRSLILACRTMVFRALPQAILWGFSCSHLQL